MGGRGQCSEEVRRPAAARDRLPGARRRQLRQRARRAGDWTQDRPLADRGVRLSGGDPGPRRRSQRQARAGEPPRERRGCSPLQAAGHDPYRCAAWRTDAGGAAPGRARRRAAPRVVHRARIPRAGGEVYSGRGRCGRGARGPDPSAHQLSGRHCCGPRAGVGGHDPGAWLGLGRSRAHRGRAHAGEPGGDEPRGERRGGLLPSLRALSPRRARPRSGVPSAAQPPAPRGRAHGTPA